MPARDEVCVLLYGFRCKVRLTNCACVLGGVQDAAYGRLQAMRRDKRARNVPFHENRRFSAHIRDLVRDGRADEARAKCTEQARPVYSEAVPIRLRADGEKGSPEVLNPEVLLRKAGRSGTSFYACGPLATAPPTYTCHFFLTHRVWS